MIHDIALIDKSAAFPSAVQTKNGGNDEISIF